jgi:hypothetical protein
MTLDYLLAKKKMTLPQWLEHNHIFAMEQFEALTHLLALEPSKESTDSARALLAPVKEKDLPVIEVELKPEEEPEHSKSTKRTKKTT